MTADPPAPDAAPLPGYYVYCLVETAERPRLPDRPAAGLAPPSALPLHDGTWMVGSDVLDPDRYSAEAIRASLADLDWVSERALAHERVVDRCAEEGAAVVPLKLLTLFRDPDTARARFLERREEIANGFDRVRGRREWGLRVHLEEGSGDPAPAAGKPRSGREFLERKRERRRAGSDRRLRVLEVFEETLALVDELAVERRDRGPLPPGGLLRDVVLLAPADRTPELEGLLAEEIARIAAAGGRLVATGPWPAYHFVSDADEDADG